MLSCWLARVHANINGPFLPPDFKDCLSPVYSAIDEADFLAIDGEFSGNIISVLTEVGIEMVSTVCVK